MKSETSFNEWENTKKAASKKSSRGPLAGIEIEKADNGFVVSCRFKPNPSKREPYGYVEPVRKVFADAAAVGSFITAQLGGGKDGTKEHESSESKAQEKDEHANGEEKKDEG